MKLLITTARRHSKAEDISGNIIVFDFDDKQVIRTCEILEQPYRKENPNPRGGLRGAKGISINNGLIAISNTSTVFLYDADWNPITYFYHPSSAGHHDLILDENLLWITSARNDLFMSMDFKGNIVKYFDVRKFAFLVDKNSWNPRVYLSESGIRNGKIDFRNPLTHDEVMADSAHVNGIAFTHNHQILISCGMVKNPYHQRLLSIKNYLIQIKIWYLVENINRFLRRKIIKGENRHYGELVVQAAKAKSVVFKIDEEDNIIKLLEFDDVAAPSHSLKILKDGTAIYLITARGELCHFDPNSGKIFSQKQVGNIFLRGVHELEDRSLVIGDGNTIIHYDLSNGEILGRYIISEDPKESVYDCYVLPDSFKMPPLSFVQLHREKMPVIQK